MFWRAFISEEFALVRFEHALEHFPALRRLRIGDSNPRYVKAPLGVELGILVANAQRRLRDKSQSAPLKVRPQLKHFGHCLKRREIALPRHNPLVLILDLGLAGVQLPQQHDD